MIGYGICGLVGAKGKDDEALMDYAGCILSCPRKCDEFIDMCVGAGNITSYMRGHFPSYTVNDGDVRNALTFYALSHFNKEVFERAWRLDGEIVDKKSFNHYKDRGESERIFANLATTPAEEIIERAAINLVLKNASFNGLGDGFSEKKNRVDIYSRGDMLQMFEGIDKVYSMDVIKLLDKLYADGPEVNSKRFIFLDPAYYKANVRYHGKSIYTTEDYHRKLCRSARRFPNILICGYESDLYAEELEQHGFCKYLIGERHVTAGSQEGRTAEEFIWTSYKIKESRVS